MSKEDSGCAPEGGNVWFTEPEPVDLTGPELVGAYVLITLLAGLSFVTVIGLVGFAFGRWWA